MSRNRDKGKQKSSPTNTTSEEASSMTAAFAPPPSSHGLVPPFQYGSPQKANEPSWGDSLPPTSQSEKRTPASTSRALRNDPANPTTPTRAASNPVRRPPGAAPLADILLPESSSPTLPELSPLRLHGESSSPERKRSEFFDPARSLAGGSQGVTSPTQSPAVQTAQAALRQPGQYLSGGFASSSSMQPPPAPARFSVVDLDRLRLIILQQPHAARACGYGERDRRVVDPPPILQLMLQNYDPNSPDDRDILRSPFNLVNCLLLSAPSRDAPISEWRDVSSIHEPNDPPGDTKRLLMGSLAMSPFIGEDVWATLFPREARIGTYYIFSDLSCRRSGFYRLQFHLTPVSITSVSTSSTTPMSRPVTSEVFEVFSAKDFPGMSASSDLTKELKRQGASVPVKKGNESKGSRKGKRQGSDSEGSSSEGSEDAGTSKAAGKKPRG